MGIRRLVLILPDEAATTYDIEEGERQAFLDSVSKLYFDLRDSCLKNQPNANISQWSAAMKRVLSFAVSARFDTVTIVHRCGFRKFSETLQLSFIFDFAILSFTRNLSCIFH